MKTQITIGNKTWCKIHDNTWIGPNLEAPSVFLKLKLDTLANPSGDIPPRAVVMAVIAMLALCVTASIFIKGVI